jgi:thiol-disulfide isomerase/thioredoxin
VIKKYQVQIDSLNKETDDEKRNAVRERLAPYFMEVNKINYDFFSKHPASYFTAYCLRFYLRSLSIDSLLMFYSRLAPPVKESEFGKFLKSKIDLLTAGSPGAVVTNFSKKDINGTDISLTGFRGKYILLDFWASWCIPCRKNSPALRVLYSKYNKSGLEIIGVSDNDSSPDAWRQAVAQDSLPWWHVLRGLDPNKKRRNERNDSDINENFGISELPTYILINPEGIIMARYQENTEAIRNDLQKIFGY